MCYKILAKFLASFGKNMQGSPDKKLPRCVTRFLPSFLQDFSKIMQGSPDKKLPRCVTRLLPSFLQDFDKIMQGSTNKKLPRCVIRFARFWQDHARQSRQEIAKMCYKILAKFLARLRQESCMILERFGTCNDIHNSESTALIRLLFL